MTSNNRGFTLMEVLVALIIAASCLAPLSLWFHKRQMNRAGSDKYYATQLLKMSLNRAVAENWQREATKEVKEPGYFKIIVDVSREGHGTAYTGRAEKRGGRVLTQLKCWQYNHPPGATGK